MVRPQLVFVLAIAFCSATSVVHAGQAPVESTIVVVAPTGQTVNDPWVADPNPTRLFFAPTARALKRGEAYFGCTKSSSLSSRSESRIGFRSGLARR